MSDNPFKLQADNKKFFTQLSNGPLQSIIEQPDQDSKHRVKRINQQLEALAKKKQQMMFKEEQLDYLFKKQSPTIQLSDFTKDKESKDKKFRVRQLLKQKKQSIHQFLNKKKEIYISKMNINIKKEQTHKLEDSIKDEEQTLKARKLYFDNDVQFMHKFIEGIKKQAQDAQTAVETQLRIQQQLMSKLNALDAQNQKIDNMKSKDEQILHNLKKYKSFIDSFHNNDRNWKPYVRKNTQQPLYLTQNDPGQDGQNKLIIKFQPINLLEIFTNAEQNNIRQIQNLHDKQDELENIIRQEKKQQNQIEKIIKQTQQRIEQLQKRYNKKFFESLKLKQLKKNNNNKINVLDNQDLDLQKVGNKIFDIYKDINAKKASQNESQRDQKDMKKAMTEIQHQIQKLRQQIKKQKELHPNLIADIQKEIKQKQKRQNMERKQRQKQQLQQKKQKQQEKKRNEDKIQKLKGRKDMTKVLVEKKVQTKKQVDIKTDDDSGKYLAEDH